jgi:hypothetical protein
MRVLITASTRLTMMDWGPRSRTSKELFRSVGRVGVIDRMHLGQIDFGVVGPKRARLDQPTSQEPAPERTRYAGIFHFRPVFLRLEFTGSRDPIEWPFPSGRSRSAARPSIKECSAAAAKRPARRRSIRRGYSATLYPGPVRIGHGSR